MFSSSFLLFVNFQQFICKLLQFFLYQGNSFFHTEMVMYLKQKAFPPLTEQLSGTAFLKYHKGLELSKLVCVKSLRCTGSEEEEKSKLKRWKTLENSRSERHPGCGAIEHDNEHYRCGLCGYGVPNCISCPGPAGSHCFTVWTVLYQFLTMPIVTILSWLLKTNLNELSWTLSSHPLSIEALLP